MNRAAEASTSPHQVEKEDADLSPTQLLQLAESHLRLRNFSLCHQYALESQQTNHPFSLSNHRHASQLLALANILSSPSNFYSILQIDTFSNDSTLIRSQFTYLLSILDPFKEKSRLAKEALSLVRKAYECLSDPTKKTQFDSLFSGQSRETDIGDDDGLGKFWTFCPYCFYMYEYARAYEGCCLRCHNHTCRRGFHAVALSSLPRMELDKGQYFGCFGYFPLGFDPADRYVHGEKKGMFENWSPIVGLFPVRMIGKTCAGKVDSGEVNGCDDGTNFIEIEDDRDHGFENGQEVKGENFGSNVEGGNVGKPRVMKRKTVAWNARKLMSKRRMGNDGHENGVGGRSGLETDDMAFFEENGEIFVGIGSDGAL